MNKEELYKLKKSFGLTSSIETEMHNRLKKITIVNFDESFCSKDEQTKTLIIDINHIYSVYGIVDFERGIILSLDNKEIPILKTNKQGKILAFYENIIQLGKDYVVPHYISSINWERISDEEYNQIKQDYLNLKKTLQQKVKQRVFK